MKKEFAEKVLQIVEAATLLPAEEQDSYVVAACGDDERLLKEVRRVLSGEDLKAENTEELFENLALPSDAEITSIVSPMKEFGPYSIVKKIGVGGMGIVYKAIDNRLDREVALKFLTPQLSEDEVGRSRFFAEAKAISKMDHANICVIFDIGETPDDQLYFAMPFYDGETLKEKMKKGTPIMECLDLVMQVCRGMAEAHRNNILHRDIKPANVMVTRDGVAKVLDFGVAKVEGQEMTQTGAAVGTISYMAPEQVDGKSTIDKRADIWALGVIFYEMLTGVKPFEGSNMFNLTVEILSADPRPVSDFLENAPPMLDDIIFKILAKDKEERYSSFDDLLQDLMRLDETLHREGMMISRIDGGPEDISQSGTYSRSTSSALYRVNDSYQFVFSGEVLDGFSTKEVRNNIQGMLHCSNLQLKQLFSGGRVVIKTNISLTEAKEIQQHFRSMGANGAIELASENSQNSSSTLPTGDSIASLNPGMDASSTGWNIRTKRRRSPTGLIVLALLLVVGGVIAAPTTRYMVIDQYNAITQDASSLDQRGVTGSTVRLGMTADFSGANAEIGRLMKIGIEAYFKAANAKGGVHGRSLALETLDDKNDEETAIANTRKFLADDGVFAMVGNVGTNTAEKILPEVLTKQSLMFGTLSGSSMLRKDPPDRYVFNYRASYNDEVAALIHYFVEEEHFSPENIAVFYVNDQYGHEGLAAIVDSLKHYKINVWDIPQADYRKGSLKVEAAVDTLLEKADELDAIIVFADYKASALFTQKMRDGEFEGEIANISPVGSRALAQEFLDIGMDYGEGVIVTQVVPHYDSYSTSVIEFRKDLETYFPNEKPNFVSLEGYLVAQVFVEGLERTGRNLTTESLIDALQSIEDFDLGVGFPVSFGLSSHQASSQVWGMRILEDGGFEQFKLGDRK